MKSGSLLRNTLLYIPAQVFAPLLQFLVTVIWTHLFDPAAFGLITFVVAAPKTTMRASIARNRSTPAPG